MYTHSCFCSARKKFFAVSMSLGMLLMPFAAQAIEVNGIVKLGMDFGGDSMVKAYFTNGNSAEINANEGLLLAGGVSITNDARNFALDTTLGWKSASIDASNQDYEFNRYPLDVLAFYNIPLGKKNKFNLRIGGGLTYVMNPKFSASGSIENGAINFENATGVVGQVDTVIKFKGRMGINAGLRLTNVEYRVKGVTGSVNGSGAGLFVAWLF
jgi:hypothetical protein